MATPYKKEFQLLNYITIAVVVIVIIAVIWLVLDRSSEDDGDTNGSEVNEGTDADRDGMSTEWENVNGFDSKDATDAAQDADADGLTNLQEYQATTQPRDSDTDDDSVLDGVDADPKKNVLVVVEVTWVEFIDNIDTTLFLQDVREGEPYLIITIDGTQFKTDEPIEYEATSTSLNVSFTQDVPDTKQSIVVTIQLWDDDASGVDDDLCDISPTESRSLELTYWIRTNSWTGEVTTGTADGSGDGTQSTDDDDALIRFNIHE